MRAVFPAGSTESMSKPAVWNCSSPATSPAAAATRRSFTFNSYPFASTDFRATFRGSLQAVKKSDAPMRAVATNPNRVWAFIPWSANMIFTLILMLFSLAGNHLFYKS
jgi:hypothetical protein